MNRIYLNELELKTFTEQDVLDYCLLNNINLDNITEINLNNNELTDISGIKLFKNIKELYLWNNKLTDITVLKNLNNLKYLKISLNKISDISVIQYLSKLKELFLNLTDIKNISIISNLKKLEYLNIDYLWLQSDQIKYIQSLKNLKQLYCKNGFNDMKIIKQLNKNIEIFK